MLSRPGLLINRNMKKNVMEEILFFVQYIKKFSSEIRYFKYFIVDDRALSFRTDRLHSRRQYSFIVYICSV